LLFFPKNHNLLLFSIWSLLRILILLRILFTALRTLSLAHTLALILKISSSIVDPISDWFEEHERALTFLPLPDKNFTGYHADVGKAAWSCFQWNADASVGKFCLLLWNRAPKSEVKIIHLGPPNITALYHSMFTNVFQRIILPIEQR
jgi:hypothetical protein